MGTDPDPEPDGAARLLTDHREHAVAANGATWELLELDELTDELADDLLARAAAAAYHWQRAADATPAHQARAAWLLSRCHAVVGHADLALRHADRCLRIVDDTGLADFDLAYAHEARARALACRGDTVHAREALRTAAAVPIADDEDRSIFESDLASGPWFGLDR